MLLTLLLERLAARPIATVLSARVAVVRARWRGDSRLLGALWSLISSRLLGTLRGFVAAWLLGALRLISARLLNPGTCELRACLLRTACAPFATLDAAAAAKGTVLVGRRTALNAFAIVIGSPLLAPIQRSILSWRLSTQRIHRWRARFLLFAQVVATLLHLIALRLQSRLLNLARIASAIALRGA